MSGEAAGKVAIRDEGAFVVAYLSTLDGSEREEVSRINGLIVRAFPDVWEAWKAAMVLCARRAVEIATGKMVERTDELPPEMLEGRGGRSEG